MLAHLKLWVFGIPDKTGIWEWRFSKRGENQAVHGENNPLEQVQKPTSDSVHIHIYGVDAGTFQTF